MEYLSSFLANTYAPTSILIILLAILAMTLKDGNTFRRSALPFRTFGSNSQLNVACIDDLLLRRAASPEAHISESKRPTAEAGQSSTANVCKESDFPENWWTGDEVFRLERRAIFSKVGACISCKLRRRCLFSQNLVMTGMQYPSEALTTWLKN